MQIRRTLTFIEKIAGQQSHPLLHKIAAAPVPDNLSNAGERARSWSRP